jgi:hypothetical protein
MQLIIKNKNLKDIEIQITMLSWILKELTTIIILLDIDINQFKYYIPSIN